jgi:acyl-CoA synthetase (AMP-forming)/AMP-acid ligase II/acyl carrier protein
MSSDFTSLVQMLRHRAAADPERTAFVFLTGDDLHESRLTYAQLDREARSIAITLSNHNVSGQPVLLIEAPGLRFMAAIFGCLYAGAIVVPSYPPGPRENAKPSSRFLRVVQDAQPAVVIGSGKSLETAQSIVFSELPCIDLDSLPGQAEDDWIEPKLSQSDVALIQYTSGSTGAPKGVALTHGNFLNNLQVFGKETLVSASSVGVSWLPPYHDLGLFCTLLPIYAGFKLVHMSPDQFLKNPITWLKAISHFKGTISAAPNFAYDLCVRRVLKNNYTQIDLSCWEVALNGAEPVRHETLSRFSKAFSVCGFKSNAMLPCYGMAEVTLGISAKPINTEPVIERFSKQELECGLVAPLGQAETDVLPGTLQERMLVSNGRVPDSFDLKVVNPGTGSDSPANEVGEIWVAGPSVSPGYWKNDEATRETFVDVAEDNGAKRFLKTGDLGFVHDGELYITGRLKDLIIVRGLNYYPQDIEQASEAAHQAVMPNGACAFAVEKNEMEQVVVACEIARTQARKVDLNEVMHLIRSAIGEELELQVSSMVLLKQGALPRTTSGKLRRSACAQAYLDGTLNPLTQMEFGLDGDPSSERIPGESDSAWKDHPLRPTSKQGDTLREWRLLESTEKSKDTPQVHLLDQYLLRQLSSALRLKQPPIETQTPMRQFGLDSLNQVELHLALEAEFQLSMESGFFTPSNTIRELSELIQERLRDPLVSPEDQGEQKKILKLDEFVTREIPLLPVQQEFLKPGGETRGNYFVVVMLRTPVGARPDWIRSVLEWLIARHDAFRLRFHLVDGRWTQEYGSNEVALPFEILNMEGLGGEQVTEQAAAIEQELLTGFDLENGPLFRSFFFNRGTDERGILYLALHHLAVDALSIVTLISEFNQGWGSLERGQGLPALKSPEPSFGLWARQLHAKAQSREVEAEADYWLNLGSEAGTAWPWSGIVSSENKKEESADEPPTVGQVTGEQADRLLKRWSTAEELHDLFLSALVFGWCQATGEDDCYVGLEHHGRVGFKGSNPQRTVGWMVHHFPHMVRMKRDEKSFKVVETVKRLRANIPNEGVGFGLLRSMSKNGSIREKMSKIAIPRLCFVYRSGLDDTFRSNVSFPIIGHSVYKPERLVTRPSLLTLFAGKNREGIGWRFAYTPNTAPKEKVDFMSQSIKEFLLRLC